MMRRVLVLGCGSVAQCTVPLLVRDLAIDPSAVTIIDMIDNRDRVRAVLAAGVLFVCYWRQSLTQPISSDAGYCRPRFASAQPRPASAL